MRHRLNAGRFALTAVGLVLASGILGACSSDDQPAVSQASGSGLTTRTVEAGAVTVEIDPKELDGGGAAFIVSFDTHSVDLGFDVVSAASLEVDGTAWTDPAWKGDPAGGHHRSGTLTFRPGGPATGTARLTISGLPEPVVATWDLGSP